MASKNSISGPVKAPLGSYPKLWRLLDHYFLKEDVPDRTALAALDTIVELNESVLRSPKSANHRAIRRSEPRIRNLVEMGGTDILTEIGWKFKVQRMEECWVLPWDADLEALQTQQDKIVETKATLLQRYTKSLAATTGRAAQERAEKAAIVRQIEEDRAEREHRKALRSGAPPAPTQSLDAMRKQAVKERMERDKARQGQATLSQPSPMGASLPGSFPSHASLATPDTYGARDDDDDEDDDEDDEDEAVWGRGGRRGGPTGGRSPRVRGPSRRTGPVPIPVTKPVERVRYAATENTLGGHLPEHADEDDSDD